MTARRMTARRRPRARGSRSAAAPDHGPGDESGRSGGTGHGRRAREEERVVGLVADLVAWARAAHAAPPLFATHLVVGPRFTAVGAAPRPDGAAPPVGGLAHNGAAEVLAAFDSAAAT